MNTHGGGSSSSSSTPHAPRPTASAAAALQGASLAFHRRKGNDPSAPTHAAQHHHGGGLMAASLSAQSTGGSSGLPDIDAAASREIVAARMQQLGGSRQRSPAQQQQQQLLQARTGGGKVDRQSQSLIAATLAASRSVSPKPRDTTAGKRFSMDGTRRSVAAGGADVDAESIASAGSLISMFEGDAGPRKEASPERRIVRRVSPAASVKRPARPPAPLPKPSMEMLPHASHGQPTKGQGTAGTEGNRKPSKPPKPTTPSKPSIPPALSSQPVAGPEQQSRPTRTAQKQPELPTRDSLRAKTFDTPGAGDAVSEPRGPQPHTRPGLAVKGAEQPKPKLDKPTLEPSNPPPRQPRIARSTTEILSPRPRSATKPRLPPPTAPQYQKTISRPPDYSPQDTALGDPHKHSAGKENAKKQPPTPPKPRRDTSHGVGQNSAHPVRTTPRRRHTAGTEDTQSTQDVFVSAPTSPEASPPALPSRGAMTVAAAPPSPYRRGHAHTPSGASAHQVSNMDLGDLTSAIMAGSLAARLTPSNTGSSPNPPPSPPQRTRTPRLRQTMRGPPREADDDAERRQRKAHHHHRHKLHGNKHAHHEGSRKKWRDEIRPGELKRYEAVWASNRGTLLPPGSGAAADHVSNVVVRDIWRRSRLPEDELAEVWDLVDRERRGALGRQAFVVGMWLIDQRLKGRKIPAKVSDSVWGSANGLRVKGPRAK